MNRLENLLACLRSSPLDMASWAALVDALHVQLGWPRERVTRLVDNDWYPVGEA